MVPGKAMQASSTFEIASWDESACAEYEGGAKLTKASVVQSYQGDLVGEGCVEFLISHGAEGSAHFAGFERVTGSLSGKQGSFMIQHVGSFGATGALSEWQILSGSGTGELAGIAGRGSYAATGKVVEMDFTYELGELG